MITNLLEQGSATIRYRYLLLLLACLLPATVVRADLSPQQERGKAIYLTGKSSVTDQDITAYFGSELIAIPAETTPCASCHGYNGTGRPESGLIPSNITWKFLTKPYGHRHPAGVEHKPFTPESLKTYLKEGLFPGGLPGRDPNMPLFEMADQDLEDLVAYMTQLGNIAETGISATRIRIGTLLPGDGPLADIGRAINNILKAYFAEVNNNGGIYGRKLELVTLFLSEDQQEDPLRMRRWLQEQQVFALLSTFLPEAETHLADAVKTQQIPLIGPFTLFPLSTYSLNRQTFYLYPGLTEQMRILLQFAAKKIPLHAPRLAVLYPRHSSLETLLADLRQGNRNRHWETPLEIPLDTEPSRQMIGRLQKAAIDLVIFLGDERQMRLFLQAAEADRWAPYLLGSGLLAGQTIIDAPDSFSERIFLSYPLLPEDRKGWGTKELWQLQQQAGLPNSHIQAGISTYTSAKILVEALRLSGRKVDRKQLIDALEQFTRFETGLTPPISYSGNQHIGVRGTHIIRFKSQNKPGEYLAEATWVELN